MTDGVTKQYELVSTRAVLLDIISTNISDPLTGQEARSSTTHWIFEGEPNPADLGKPAPKGWKFPIISFDYPEVSTENKVVSGTKQSIINQTLVTIRARTRAVAVALADQVTHILTTTGQSELKIAALFGPDVLSTTHSSDYIGGNKYYEVMIDFQFKRFD
jgi:hypothetical protein